MAAPKNLLAGVRVLVTRPHQQAEPLARLLEEAGASAVRFPVVEILDPEDSTALIAIIHRLAQFDIAIFISPNAVNKACNLIRQHLGDVPPTVKIACIGRASAKALQHFGIEHPLTPAGRFNSEALLALPELQHVAGQHIVIFRGDGGRELLGNTLVERGASVTYAECYRRARPNTDVTPLLRQWAHGAIDIVTITSVAGLRNLFDMVGKLGQQWLVKTPVVVLSAEQAAACRELGFKTQPIVAREASDEAILEAIYTWRAQQVSL